VAASFQTPNLFEIAADMGVMQVEASVDEADIGQVRVGQPVRFTVDAYPDETFRAVVHVGGQPRGEGTGPSKKQAEQVAAELAVRALSGPADPVAAAAGA